MKQMKKIRVITVALVVFALAMWETAFALRCQGRIVSRRQTKAQVRKICGEPSWIQGPQVLLPYTVQDPTYAVWYYDFGTGYLVHKITFSFGRVDMIQTVDQSEVEEPDF